MASPPPLLVTIASSHYCEKARWALERYGVPFVEEVHAPLFHRVGVMRAGGRRTVPVLSAPQFVLADSSLIVRWVDGGFGEKAPPTTPLYPRDAALAGEVARWERRFDEELGPLTRRWAYCWLVGAPETFRTAMDRRLAPAEGLAFRATSGPLLALIGRLFKVSDEARGRLFRRILRLFDDVDAALAGGRSYLVGDGFTAADLALAALAGPAIRPPGYGGPSALPYVEPDLPGAVRREIEEMRARPAGAHVLAMYERHRLERVDVGT